MPQAIRPGSFMNMYGQTLLQSLLVQGMQALAGGAQAGGLGGLGGLGGGLGGAITNPLLLAQVDGVLTNTMATLDSQLASVGIGLGLDGLTGQQPTAGLPNPSLIPRPQLTPGDNRGPAAANPLTGALANPLGGLANPLGATPNPLGGVAANPLQPSPLLRAGSVTQAPGTGNFLSALG